MPSKTKLYDLLGNDHAFFALVFILKTLHIPALNTSGRANKLYVGIAPNVSSDEIKKAFREKALQWHPDKNHGDVKAEEKFKGGQSMCVTSTRCLHKHVCPYRSKARLRNPH